MLRGLFLGALAGAAVAGLPGNPWVALAGAIAGGIAGWKLVPARAGFSPWSLAVLAFVVPAITLPVAPGADMAMHVALARGLVHGVLSPAWPGVRVALYPRGFSALVAALAPAGWAEAGLLAAGASYLVFWAGLAAILEALRTPAARTMAAVALLLSRTPQAFFGWGGNATAMAIGLALFGAAQEGPIAALFLAGAAATHPMGGCAGALAVLLRREWRTTAWAAAGLGLVLVALALLGPALSAREIHWIRDYAGRQESAGFGVLGDPANIVTGLAAAVLLWRRQFRPLLRSAAAVAGLAALFLLLPYAGMYPVRFAPLLLVAVVPLWAQAAAAQIPMLAPLALLAALPGHLRWYQEASPMATREDLAAIRCLRGTVPDGAVIDGAYGDATQWIPALAGRPITRPHQHVSLFDETDAALAKLPSPSWRFVGDTLRYPPAIGPPPADVAPLCDRHLYKR